MKARRSSTRFRRTFERLATVGNPAAGAAGVGRFAVTADRIEGIHHEFSSIPGVMEDATDVVLNFKRCQRPTEEPIIFSTKQGSRRVTAGDVFKTRCRCVQSDLVVFTSTSDSTLIEIGQVARGRGYVTAENFELEHAPLGTSPGREFLPVTRELSVKTRVGQRTD